jgi:hypothetical protein
MKRRLALIAVVLGVPCIAALRPSPVDARRQTVAAPCMTDTAIRNYVLWAVKSLLDAPPFDSLAGERLVRRGLSGVAFSQVSVVEDSAACERARIAYTGIVYPGAADAVDRRTYIEFLKEVLVLRLTPNRLLLATDVYNPITAVEMFLVDSTYALVRRGL